MEQSKLNRRNFLRMSAMAAAGAMAVACQPQTVIVKETVEVEKVVKETVEVEKVVEKEKVVKETVVVEKEKVVEVVAVSDRQSPVAQELVKAGKLPPLEDRMPVTPKVCVDGVELPRKDLTMEIGQYGGLLRSVHPGPNWNALLFISQNEPLVNAPGVGVREPGVIWPNVFKEFKVSDEGKTFTFLMREGMRWSDGEPVTTEDMLFAYQNVLLNEKTTPGFPQYLKSANKVKGQPVKLEALDTYTVRMTFDQPYGGFLTNLALVGWQAYHDLLKPKHYLIQFHPDYTPLDELEPLIAKEGLQKGEWWTYFNKMDITRMEFMYPDAVNQPTLAGWMCTEVGATVTKWERNPYFWKVDAEGNQLPYIDGLQSELVQDMQMVTMKTLGGEVDFISYGTGGVSAKNLPLYKENADKAGYTVHLLGVHNTPTNVYLNLTHTDPVWRTIMSDVRTRQALNMGINRDEILESMYFGLASLPWQIPSEYDPEKAMQMLDEVGLDKKDSDGFRLGPDGKVFEIPFEIVADAEDKPPVTELIVEYWNTLGIKTSMKIIEGGLHSQRLNANELKAYVTWNATLTMWWQIWGLTPNLWAPLWNQWINSGGESGEQPPEEAQRFVELIYQSVAVSPESAERQKIIDEYLGILKEQLYSMPTVVDVKAPLILNKAISNVAKDGFAIAAYYAAEQWYYKQ